MCKLSLWMTIMFDVLSMWSAVVWFDAKKRHQKSILPNQYLIAVLNFDFMMSLNRLFELLKKSLSRLDLCHLKGVLLISKYVLRILSNEPLKNYGDRFRLTLTTNLPSFGWHSYCHKANIYTFNSGFTPGLSYDGWIVQKCLSFSPFFKKIDENYKGFDPIFG